MSQESSQEECQCVQQWESLDPQATDEHRIKYLAHGNKALEQAALALYHESQGAA